MNKISKVPYLIAEISSNHRGKFENAKKLIEAAKKNGADAVKLQTFTPESMTINSNKKIFKISEGEWKGYNYWNLYNKARTPYSWHQKLFTFANKIGITIFSTPFDEEAVDFLEQLSCPMYKISSFEMTDLTLIKRVARTKKPIIISTGLASLNEIEKSYNIAQKYGSKEVILLYCVSQYPAKNSDFNLNNIKILKETFGCKVGLSDHSNDNNIAMASVAAGAEIFEKHIILDNQKKGLDYNFSLRGRDFRKLRQSIDNTYALLGKQEFHRSKSELKNLRFRRSIFAVEDIKKGEKFTQNNIKKLRPGAGISSSFYETILNKKSPQKIKKNNPITKQILKKINVR